jgi:pilus assembly protein Flp/PilA
MAERRVIMKEMLKSFWTDESGQGLTEYALIIALVSIGLIAILIIFRNAIGGVFNAIRLRLEQAPAGEYQPG